MLLPGASSTASKSRQSPPSSRTGSGMVVFLTGQALFKALVTNPHFLRQASVLACE